MRIAVQALGTRGDIQPFLALAIALKARGHTVSFATDQRFAPLIARYGIATRPLPGDLIDLMETPAGRRGLTGGVLAKRALLKAVRPAIRAQLDAQAAAVENPEAIVYHPKAIGARHLAERLGIPAFVALPIPALTPTRAFPSPLLPVRTLGPFNALSHRLVAGAERWLFGAEIAAFRANLGLTGRLSRHPVTTLYAYSPLLVPTPADFGPDVVVTGSWDLVETPDWTPPPALEAFLSAGPPPVYIGFGSMPARDPVALANLAVEALLRTRTRGLLATGWGGLEPGRLPPGVYALGEAPHDWLFPRMAAAVHHGGAGTTMASLRAGLPTIICPVLGDQPFWARQVEALKVGLSPGRLNSLTVKSLARAIDTAVEDIAMRRRAILLARDLLLAPSGTTRAAEAIEARVPSPRTAPAQR